MTRFRRRWAQVWQKLDVKIGIDYIFIYSREWRPEGESWSL